MPPGPLQDLARATDFDPPGVGRREVEEIEPHDRQIEQERARAVSRVYDLELRVIQIADVPGGEFVGKPDDAVGALRLRNSGHNDPWELVGRTVLQIGVHRQDDGIILAVGKLLQPGGIGAAVVLKGDGNAAAGSLPARVWRGNEPVAQVAVTRRCGWWLTPENRCVAACLYASYFCVA